MQAGRADGERSQVRVDFDDALDLLDSELDEAIVAAGAALAVLDEDEAAGELMYVHQLVQEYFAARELAREPDPDPGAARVASGRGRAQRCRRCSAGLDPADPLPPLPTTGWEETTLLAAAMTAEPAALHPRSREREPGLGRPLRGPVRSCCRCCPRTCWRSYARALVTRSRDPEADLRDRIACGLALGDLGDPRFERGAGPDGAFLLPPMVAIPAGSYPHRRRRAVRDLRHRLRRPTFRATTWRSGHSP